MRKLILSVAVLGSALAAVPALAQDYRGQSVYQQDDRGYRDNDRGYRDNDRGYGNGYGNQSSQRLRQIGIRIDRNIQAGRLSRREASALRREYNYLVSLDRRLRAGGLTRWERNTLDQRTNLLATRLQQYRGDGYANAYANGNRIDDRDQPRVRPY